MYLSIFLLTLIGHTVQRTIKQTAAQFSLFNYTLNNHQIKDFPVAFIRGMSKRKAEATDSEMAATAEKTSPAQDFVISLAQPLKDYQKLIETRVQVDEIVEDEVTKENFTRTAAAARDVIWQLLFSTQTQTNASESQQKAGELLEEYKGDACFYAPWAYNEWIVKLRDELLKRENLDFWRETIVKKQLGPCWSRDSDLFDSDDKPPLEFYDKAGCKAPFAASLKVKASHDDDIPLEGAEAETASAEAAEDQAAAQSGNFEASISKEQPLTDYRNLMQRFVLTNITVPDEIHRQNVNKIAKSVREVIWQLLFEGTPSAEVLDTVSELLQEYKSDAGFYGPWEYNEWVVKLRDEMLKKEHLLDFWREKMVKLELGPCWARDSDFFEGHDPVPMEFYEKAGCKAPFEAPDHLADSD